MKILACCAGSRGDTQPVLALAVALRSHGHEIVLFVPATHAKMCRDQRFEPRVFEFDAEAMVAELLTTCDKASYGTGLSFIKKSIDIMKKPENKAAWKKALPSLWEAARDFKPDVVLSAAAFPLVPICEKLRVPLVQIVFQATPPSREFPPFVINDGQPLKWFSRWHKWLGQKVWPMAVSQSWDMQDAGTFTKEVLQMQHPIADRALFLKIAEWAPLLISVAPEVVPPPKDYGRHQHFTGWFFLDENTDDFVAESALVQFLEASGPPIMYVGFGSMKGSDAMSTDLSRIALTALRAAGLRGILCGGWAGLTRERLGSVSGDAELQSWAAENVMELQAVPHSWIFPKVRAVCHHGGAGTLGAGLRAGCPTVCVPFTAEQPYWAAAIEAQGLGRKAPPVTKLSAQSLVPLFQDVTTNEVMQAKVSSTSAAIKARDSVGDAEQQIDLYMKHFPYPWPVDCQAQTAEAVRERRRMFPFDTAQETCCGCSAGVIKGF